eukprot:6538935-Prymnesium_polylepis.2
MCDGIGFGLRCHIGSTNASDRMTGRRTMGFGAAKPAPHPDTYRRRRDRPRRGRDVGAHAMGPIAVVTRHQPLACSL